jgi:hypothetical protein
MTMSPPRKIAQEGQEQRKPIFIIATLTKQHKTDSVVRQSSWRPITQLPLMLRRFSILAAMQQHSCETSKNFNQFVANRHKLRIKWSPPTRVSNCNNLGELAKHALGQHAVDAGGVAFFVAVEICALCRQHGCPIATTWGSNQEMQEEGYQKVGQTCAWTACC